MTTIISSARSSTYGVPQEMDIAFLPYESVTPVPLSPDRPEARKLGFSLEGSSAALRTAATSTGGVP